MSTLPGAMKWSTLHQEQRAVSFARSKEMVNFTSGATSCQLCQEQGNGQLYIRSNELSALQGEINGQLYIRSNELSALPGAMKGQLYIRSNELSALPGAMKGQLYLKQQVICDHLSQGQLELILTEHTQR